MATERFGYKGLRAIRPGAVALLLVLALLAGACGGSGDESGDATPTSSPTSEGSEVGDGEAPGSGDNPDGEDPSGSDGLEEEPEPTPTPTPGPTEPLTGEPLEDPSIMDRPALAIKIGNSGLGRPQTGINQADMIIEVRVEGITRLFAVFHSQGADPVGPTRSARSSDPDILANFGQPIFGHSGANPGVLREVFQGQREGKLYELRWDHLPNDYFRIRDRAVPWNLYTTTSAIWAAAPDSLEAPEPLFEYRQEGESLPEDVERVPGVEIRYDGGGGTVIHFVWDEEAEGWARWQDGTPHVDMAREVDGTANSDVDPVQYAPANVVLLRTSYVISTPCSSCPQAVTVNPDGGGALVFTDGHLIRGEWTRPTSNDPWEITDNEGNPVLLTPGQTFIGLPGGDILLMVDEFAENLLESR